MKDRFELPAAGSRNMVEPSGKRIGQLAAANVLQSFNIVSSRVWDYHAVESKL